MRFPWVCLSVCFLVHTIAIFVSGSRFKYHQYRRDGDDCNICYLDECWSINQARCEYYLLSDQSTPIEEGGRTTEVDKLMYEFIDEATTSELDRDCVPFITYYTDCQKENTCLGCKSCTCNSEGSWNCIVEQHCRGEREVVPDHRVFNTVIDTLAYNKERKRRSLTNTNTSTTNKPGKISYAQLGEWMFGAKPTVETNMEILKAKSKYGSTTTKQDTSENPFRQNHNQNIDYIDLDDVLNTIGLPNNKRRKAILDEKSYGAHDFMDLNDIKVPKTANDFIDMFNELETGGNDNNTVESSTKVVIDLLVSASNGSFDFLNRDYEVGDAFDMEDDLNNTSLQGLLNTARNIIKRQVSSVIATNETKTVTIKHEANATNVHVNDSNVNINSLTDDVLNPINDIIAEKEKEIKYLFRVKDNLLTFIKSYNDTEITLSMKNNTKTSNDSFSIYKLDIYPELQYDLRKTNPNNLDKLLYKLKRDIYEVVKDISSIQKVSKTRDLPEDLRKLIKSMKFYIRNKKAPKNETVNSESNKDMLRRNSFFYTAAPITNRLINIFKVIDKNLPEINSLDSLTPRSRKVVKRVIKNYYYDDSFSNGLQVYDPEYNLTNNLREIGINWNRYLEMLDNCDNSEVIFAMKLLHYGLSSDIVKIGEALTLVNFAHSRRMVPVEGRVGEQLTDQIINGLKTINNKIEYYVNLNHKYDTFKNHDIFKNHEKKVIKKSKKKSFMKKIKNLMKGAKNDIRHLFRSRISTSDIVKTLARQKLNETNDDQMTEYQSIMKKWQNNLNLIRKKRSSRMEKLRSRLTNILPKYLRGKLNPAIDANKKKAITKRVSDNHYDGVRKVNNRRKSKITTSKPKGKATRLPQTSVKHVTSRPALRSKTSSKPKLTLRRIINNINKG